MFILQRDRHQPRFPVDAVLTYYRPKKKLREGNVLSRVTITRDALDLTVQAPSPPPTRHGTPLYSPLPELRLLALNIQIGQTETKSLQGDNIEKEQQVYCPQWVTEDMTSLRQLFGSLKDERSDPESVGRLRFQEMDVEIIRNYEPDEEDLEEDDMDYDLKRIYPYVAL